MELFSIKIRCTFQLVSTKNDLLTSKNNRNEKDREQFRSNRIRSKGR